MSQHFNIPREAKLTVVQKHTQIKSHKRRHLESQALIGYELLFMWATLENILQPVAVRIFF